MNISASLRMGLSSKCHIDPFASEAVPAFLRSFSYLETANKQDAAAGRRPHSPALSHQKFLTLLNVHANHSRARGGGESQVRGPQPGGDVRKPRVKKSAEVQQASPLLLTARLLSIQPHESKGHFIFSPPPRRPHYARRGTRRSLAGAGLIAVYHGCHSRHRRRGPDLDQRGLAAPPLPPLHLLLHRTFTPHLSSGVFCCVFFPSVFNCRFRHRHGHVLQLCILRAAAAAGQLSGRKLTRQTGTSMKVAEK